MVVAPNNQEREKLKKECDGLQIAIDVFDAEADKTMGKINQWGHQRSWVRHAFTLPAHRPAQKLICARFAFRQEPRLDVLICLQKSWLDKLDRAVDELVRKACRSNELHVARALVHADYDTKALGKKAERFFPDRPDKRRRVWRSAKRVP